MSSSPAAFQRRAREFNDYLSSLLTRTITEHPLRPIIRPQVAFLSFRGAERFEDSPSIELGNGCEIRISQIIVPNPEQPRKVRTVDYSYSYALGPDPDEDWVLRYDYVPEQAGNPEYKYPIAHVHFNGISKSYESFPMPEKKPLPNLHCPTGRITLEDFIEHLIIELHVPTHGPQEAALALLAESREEFHRERRTR